MSTTSIRANIAIRTKENIYDNNQVKSNRTQNNQSARKQIENSQPLQKILHALIPLLSNLVQQLKEDNNSNQPVKPIPEPKTKPEIKPEQVKLPVEKPVQPKVQTSRPEQTPSQGANLRTNEFSEKIIDKLFSWLTKAAPDLPREIADRLQNIITQLGKLFDVDVIKLELDPETQLVSVNDPTPTASVQWDTAVQQAVVNTSPGPTIASRAYAMMHTAMYDAWSAYDETAISTQLDDDLQRPADENTEANKREAMSHAAYQVLTDVFGSETEIFDELMSKQGYDPDSTSTAAGVGQQMASALLEMRHNDGSNQLGTSETGKPGVAYSDVTTFKPVNETGNPSDMEHWTPEFVPIDSSGNAQEFLTPQWGNVIPFSLDSGDQFRPPEPEPFLLVEGEVDLHAKTITLADGTEKAIDKSLVGTIINPEFIAQAEHVVDVSKNLTDTQKLIAEFWEDGGGTSFPPGALMTFGQFTSVRDNHTTDEDAQLFFALGNAEFDAGVASWEAKVHYDYARPVRAIRELGELGLIGEFNSDLGGYAIEAWTPENGVQKILASDFDSYQNPEGDASPPFSEYTSGHSAFSAAGAEILKRFSGSDDFSASVTFQPGTSRFETGTTPSEPVTLSWDTFSQAADESGLSRLYGGIHFTDGDFKGRTLGRGVGQVVWDYAQFFINGGQESETNYA